MTTFLQRIHVFILTVVLKNRPVGASVGRCIFSVAHSLALAVQQVLAAEITVSLGQIWSLTPVCLLDLAGTLLWVPPTSLVVTLVGYWLF